MQSPIPTEIPTDFPAQDLGLAARQCRGPRSTKAYRHYVAAKACNGRINLRQDSSSWQRFPVDGPDRRIYYHLLPITHHENTRNKIIATFVPTLLLFKSAFR